MTPETVMTLGRQAMETTLIVAAPMLLVALVVGLLVSVFQAATQITESTLSFIPKLVVVAFSILIFGSLILGLLTDFTVGQFERIQDIVK